MDVAPIELQNSRKIHLPRGSKATPLLQFLKSKNLEREWIMGLWKKNSHSNNGVTSVIDHGCEAQGRLKFVGTVAMNGKFVGELFSADTLLLGKDGEIEAEVQVAVGIISGQVKGNITARERIELSRTARIFGNIVTPILVLEEGAMFDGQCKTSRQEGQIHE
jgi:cytoskeletal protein CcmA (bactofilin family)